MRWETHPVDLRAVELLGEIRDLLAARLPLGISEVQRMRQENADLRAALDAAKEATDGS